MLFLKKFTPRVINEGSIALKGMANIKPALRFLFDSGERLLVVGDRQHKRLSSVPHNAKTLVHEFTVEHHANSCPDRIEAHPLSAAAVPQIAIVTVDVAERRGL